MGALDRLIEQQRANGGILLPNDSVAKSEWPDVWELMTVMRLKDGSARKPSSVRVWLGRGDWSVSLNDEHTRKTLYAASGTLSECWMALQLKIASPEARWVDWGSSGGQSRKK
jgi:hypothetical protein